MSKQNPIVHLRVYRPFGQSKGISYDENRKVQNENILVKLNHGVLEWNNYLKHIHANGFVKAIVEKVMKGDKEIDKKAYQDEVDKAFKPVEAPLTADQKRIADLEAKLEKLTNGSNDQSGGKGSKDGSDDGNDDLKDLKVKYEEVFGKKPFNGWDTDTIKKKIEEKQ